MSSSTPKTMFQSGRYPKTIDQFIAQMDMQFPHPRIEKENMSDSDMRRLIHDMAQREVIEELLILQSQHHKAIDADTTGVE